ncbi:MAG: cobyrinate a,c-diamide synthase, partial [Actinobacteria bacterium]|nr:cobyrinate a,c-diamide synthase [Actinomycetota bacterium]
MVSIPRVVIAAPASGHGKTSVATGLLAAFRARGRTVSPHKIGPDYIDPGYHTLAAGRPGRNLDPWLVGEHRVAPLFRHGATTPTPADIAIIEGVMGLFDGASGQGEFASTAHVARLLQAPILLVIDASGAARSVAALLHGFISFDPSVHIGGVIFNQVGSDAHATLLREAIEPMGVPVVGVVHRRAALSVPSRHLGLIPAAERQREAVAVVDELCGVIEASVDLEAVERLARSAPPLPDGDDAALLDRADPAASADGSRPRARIAVAGGVAFTFGYAEHVELLTAAGAEVVKFDPLRDEQLPESVDAVIIGGGFPEVHAARLAENVRLRKEIAALARSGAPVVAECAGLLYLSRSLDGHEMCGVLDATAHMSGRLTLGYREAVAATTSVIAEAGTRVHGHEFHRTTLASAGANPAWHWRRSPT